MADKVARRKKVAKGILKIMEAYNEGEDLSEDDVDAADEIAEGLVDIWDGLNGS